MKAIKRYCFCLLIASFFFTGCGSEPDSSQKERYDQVVFGKIDFSNGRALPAFKGQNTKLFLDIDNGTASRDTLQSVESDNAARAILHKHVKSEENTYTISRAEPQIISPAEELHLKPDSLHIMLIDVKRDLRNGDSVSVRLNFSRVGTQEIKVPIKDKSESRI